MDFRPRRWAIECDRTAENRDSRAKTVNSRYQTRDLFRSLSVLLPKVALGAIVLALVFWTLLLLMGYSAINQDVSHFSGLSRYQKANLELPRSNPKRIVFFGDSVNRSLEPSRTFPNRPYINRGITRQTTFQMLLRFHQDVIDLHQPQWLFSPASTTWRGTPAKSHWSKSRRTMRPWPRCLEATI